jgi:NAD(P)-dependent dehydrogenase (short-subunit alcohol dehydrogenase family)
MHDVTFHLDQKTALVTGATSGIGVGIAKALGEAGATVVLVGRDQARLAEVTNDVTSATAARAHGIAIDICEDGAPERLVREAVELTGRLDALVHCAGVFWPQTFAQTTLDELDGQWRTNLRAPFLLTQAALPQLIEYSGRVVFVSSMLGSAGNANCAAYAASKGGVEQLTRALAVELASVGVRVNCVAPGAIETPMNASYREDQAFYEHFRTFAPAQRWGRVDDIAPVVTFLVSDAADFMHGAIVPVDGGWVAQ